MRGSVRLTTPLARKQSPRLFGNHSRCRTSASFSGQRRRSRPHQASVRSLFGTIARRLGGFRPGPSLFSALGSYASRLPTGNLSAAQPVKIFMHEPRSSPILRAFRRPSTPLAASASIASRPRLACEKAVSTAAGSQVAPPPAASAAVRRRLGWARGRSRSGPGGTSTRPRTGSGTDRRRAWLAGRALPGKVGAGRLGSLTRGG